ncbi:MAG: phosphatase PAP2 family protein [Solirubrobacterales bacterium]|nr:phosphatase PAP2 family protein [Solirubrobacterales bacterium]
MKDADQSLLYLMRTRGHARWAERAAQVIAKSGENGYLWFGIGLLGAAVDRPRSRRWLAASLVGPAAIGFNFGIKLLVKRPRPRLEGLPPLGGAPSSLSFPSAHATASFAAATAMTRIEPRAGTALFAAAALMAATRPYLGMHYPSDVLAGAALGSALGASVPLPGPHPGPATGEPTR